MEEKSYIEKGIGGTAFVGPEATKLFAMASLVQAIRLYLNTNGALKASRFHTMTNMLRTASKHTGKIYTHSKPGLLSAYLDLSQQVETIKAKLPVVDKTKKN